MSRMSKFLKQRCTLEVVETDGMGNPVMNDYGELSYSPSSTIPCRREKHMRDVETPTGAVLKSLFQYYTVQEIGINDKLDGKVVLSVEEYTNSRGETEGYRSIT